MVFPILLQLAISLGSMAAGGGGSSGGGGGGGRITGAGLTWTSDTISPKMLAAAKNAPVFLAKTTQFYALQTETYAKSKAPWRDRTGNARSGLTATPSAQMTATGGVYQIELFHRVPYGIWLEVRHGGRYQIIDPTIQVQGQAFFAAASQMFASMFGGR